MTGENSAAKTVVVTGGSGGLGYECAKALLESGQGWHVIIASHHPERSAASVDRLVGQTGNAAVEAMTLDLASLASIRQFARALQVRLREGALPPLRAVVANAGVQHVRGTRTTEDGFEAHFGINHLGHFLLMNLLLRDLVAPARIVLMSSDTHDPQATPGVPPPRWRDPEMLAWPDRHPDPAAPRGNLRAGMTRYATSKLAAIYTTQELARRLEAGGLSTPERPIAVLSFGPGMVPGTGLARDHARVVRFLWHRVLPALRHAPMNVHSAATSGGRMARLVLDPDLEQVAGGYFVGLDQKRSSAESYDELNAARLWEASVDLVALERHESVFDHAVR